MIHISIKDMTYKFGWIRIDCIFIHVLKQSTTYSSAANDTDPFLYRHHYVFQLLSSYIYYILYNLYFQIYIIYYINNAKIYIELRIGIFDIYEKKDDQKYKQLSHLFPNLPSHLSGTVERNSEINEKRSYLRSFFHHQKNKKKNKQRNTRFSLFMHWRLHPFYYGIMHRGMRRRMMTKEICIKDTYSLIYKNPEYIKIPKSGFASAFSDFVFILGFL